MPVQPSMKEQAFQATWRIKDGSKLPVSAKAVLSTAFSSNNSTPSLGGKGGPSWAPLW